MESLSGQNGMNTQIILNLNFNNRFEHFLLFHIVPGPNYHIAPLLHAIKKEREHDIPLVYWIRLWSFHFILPHYLSLYLPFPSSEWMYPFWNFLWRVWFPFHLPLCSILSLNVELDRIFIIAVTDGVGNMLWSEYKELNGKVLLKLIYASCCLV